MISSANLVLTFSLFHPRKRISFPDTQIKAGLLRHAGGTHHSDGEFGREIKLEAGWARTDGDLTLGLMCLSLDRITLGGFELQTRLGRFSFIHYLLFIQQVLLSASSVLGCVIGM